MAMASSSSSGGIAFDVGLTGSAVLPNRIKRRLEQPATEAAARKETLEARLLRAERQRTNYLKQKGGCAGACHNQGHRMIEQGDIMSRKLARCWRRFRRVKGTTYELAQNFSSCGVNLRSVASLPFEELAIILMSPRTLQSAKALLTRLESRLMLSVPDPSGVPKVEHLLKRLVPRRKVGSSGQQRKMAISQKSKLDRYPVRVFLCAYMIIGHPDSVFHTGGDDVREVTLAEAAAKLIPEFERLVSTILGNKKEAASKPLSSQLVSFDAAWRSYLSRFVAWKTKDVKLLEEDLINIACNLELLKSQGGASDIYKEALENQKLLKDRVFRITGKSGVKKMEDALASTRSQFLESSPSTELTNEQILNEILHDASGKTLERPTAIGRIQAQVKATVENAFWASVEETFVKGQDHDQIVGLIREIRQGLEDVVPEAWKEELHESLDVELVSQVLKSGSNDFRYLQKLMDYSVSLIVKLGAPARDRELMDAYASLLEDLSKPVETKEAFGKALVKGIRFTLEHLQKLKQDISTAKLQLITGYSGVEYLQKAFAKRYDLKPEDAPQQLAEKIPRAAEWISNVKSTLQVQKREIDAALNALPLASSGSSQRPTVHPIRTGGRVGGTPLNSLIMNSEAEERSIGKAPWGTTEAAVRLGLLDIICGSESWTEESLPETLHLNVGRIRNCQNDFQRIAVMATASLILRQELRGKLEAAEVERAIQEGAQRLDTLLGELSISIAKIGSVLAQICSEHCREQYQDVNACTEYLVRVLERSLSAGDIIFGRVASAVRNSLRAMLILGNNGPEGISLAKAELNKIGAVLLIRDILVLGGNLAKMSTVTAQVHGPWYTRLLAAIQE